MKDEELTHCLDWARILERRGSPRPAALMRRLVTVVMGQRAALEVLRSKQMQTLAVAAPKGERLEDNPTKIERSNDALS